MATKSPRKRAAKTEPAKATTEPLAVSALPVLGEPLPANLFPEVPPLPPQPLLPSGNAGTPGASVRGMVYDSVTGQWRPARGVSAPMAPIGTGRRFNPTFDAPPPSVVEARNRAQGLRSALFSAMQGLMVAVQEVDQVATYVAAAPEAAAEFERLGISLEEAAKFRAEALDVINLFKPEEATEVQS